jgi:hypothetical protein
MFADLRPSLALTWCLHDEPFNVILRDHTFHYRTGQFITLIFQLRSLQIFDLPGNPNSAIETYLPVLCGPLSDFYEFEVAFSAPKNQGVILIGISSNLFGRILSRCGVNLYGF